MTTSRFHFQATLDEIIPLQFLRGDWLDIFLYTSFQVVQWLPWLYRKSNYRVHLGGLRTGPDFGFNLEKQLLKAKNYLGFNTHKKSNRECDNTKFKELRYLY